MVYQFHFPETNVTQLKTLIRHEDWKAADCIEDGDERKTAIKKLAGGKEWFTDQSPLYEAISTGVLNCNGKHKCTAIKIA